MTRRPFDPTLYLVTDPEQVGAARALTDVVRQAVAGGVTLVQLRDKQADGRELLEQARALKAVLDPLGVPLLVNDRVDVAVAAGVGAHVGQTDLPAAEARRQLGPDVLLGTSIDEVEQARDADPAVVDYVAFGPFAATATKADAGAAVGAEKLTAVRALTPLPLVAIGGIDAKNAGSAIAAGADGVAVVSAIMAAEDPQGAARALRATIDGAHARREERQA